MTTEEKPFSTVSYHDAEKRLNVSAIADRILFSGDPEYACSLVLLSVLGPHSAVRGILAMAAGRWCELRFSSYPKVRLYGSEGGRLLTAAISKEVTHGIYLSPSTLLSAKGHFDLLEASPEHVYARLTHAYAFPSLPSWAEWIVRSLKADRRITPLMGQGAQGLTVSVSEEDLDLLVARGVKEKALTF
jgi:hypothetical protein